MVIEIEKEKYSYVYFVKSGALYCVDQWTKLGTYPDIKDLIHYNVKSWKPHWIQFILGNYRIVNGKDKYGDCERVYLGLKSK